MPLSKARNRERMRQSRLHKQHLSPQESEYVQPKGVWRNGSASASKSLSQGSIPCAPAIPEIDADGNRIYE